jgi:protein phosphatase
MGSVKARILRLTLPPERRILAVSDVHGNLPYLKGVLEKANFSTDDELFIVGDLLEKGEHSLDTLRYVMELSRTHHVHVSSGNCDWWYPILYSEELARSQNSLWYINRKPYNLARQMCREIGYPVDMDMDVADMRDTLRRAFPEEFEFLRRMPEIIDTPSYTFVHGGLPQGEPEEWDAWQCMKFDRFRDQGRKFDKWVICGHWPVMLYNEDIVCANPIIDCDAHIASIDGGCVLKDDGQLNALIIPYDGSEDFSFVAYDSFPTATVLDGQEASEKSWYIRWGDAKVQVLSRGEEFCRCRHIRTGYEMDILTKYVYGDGDEAIVNDCTDYVLPLAPGDRVSVVETTSRGYFVKHRGVSGWYKGRLKLD